MYSEDLCCFGFIYISADMHANLIIKSSSYHTMSHAELKTSGQVYVKASHHNISHPVLIKFWKIVSEEEWVFFHSCSTLLCTCSFE